VLPSIDLVPAVGKGGCAL